MVENENHTLSTHELSIYLKKLRQRKEKNDFCLTQLDMQIWCMSGRVIAVENVSY